MKTNNVLLIGYVGADPVITITVRGTKRASLRVATHMPNRNESGDKIWNTVWHDIIAWNTTAAYASQNFVKGSKIMVDGSIEYWHHVDRNGTVRHFTHIKAQSLVNLDR